MAADRLPTGDLTGPEHRGLAAWLEAAKAPPSAGELAGERAAVAAFVAAYREAGPAHPLKGRRRVRIPSPAGVAAVKVAAAVAVLAVGGAALAAETGRLPAGTQQRVHDLLSGVGVPAPQRSTPSGGGPAAPAPTRAPGAAPARSPAVSPAPATPPATRSAPPGVRGLCHAWAAHRRPRGKALAPAARRALTGAAGSEADIPAFCTGLIGNPGPAAAPGRPSAPGKPPPHARGNGRYDGAGEGQRRHPGSEMRAEPDVADRARRMPAPTTVRPVRII